MARARVGGGMLPKNAGSVVATGRGFGQSVCGSSGEAIPKMRAQNAQGDARGGGRREYADKHGSNE